MTQRYALTDEQWLKIRDLLPGRSGHTGRPAKDNRLFIDAVLHRYRSGSTWRDLPERFGDFRVVHLRHTRWSQKDIWKAVFDVLAADANHQYAMIDSTIVRAHQHSAGPPKKRAAKRKPSVAVGAA
jgi:transposase